MPCSSSSAPGPSPTNTSGACSLPDAEDDLVAAFVQAAAAAIADVLDDLEQRVAGGRERRQFIAMASTAEVRCRRAAVRPASARQLRYSVLIPRSW